MVFAQKWLYQSLRRPKPILKWAGGKQQLLDTLLSRVPLKYNKYIEPFLGGGALFFGLMPKDAIIADLNPEIINLYQMVAKDVDTLIELLRLKKTDEDTYYATRALDPNSLSLVEQAARTIFLNRNCFNGLYRVNRKGLFNVPYGRYKNPMICDAENLKAASSLLKNAKIFCGDYKTVLHTYAEKGDFIFLDPPYLPTSQYSDFKRYTKEQFYEDDHIELAQEIERLQNIGCHVILTNSNHPLVQDIYSKYKIEVFNTRRNISSDATKRRGEDCVITIEPIKAVSIVRDPIRLPDQMNMFPSTRYMGSKQNLLEHIWGVSSSLQFDSVLDLFSGSCAVAYMFKTQGKRVLTNDYMALSACFSGAMITNNHVTLSEKEISSIAEERLVTDRFVSETFKDLYFSDEDNAFIDSVRLVISQCSDPVKKNLVRAALIRACLKKRPRGIFTYTGFRYDDGRRDLRLSLKEQFLDAVQQINAAVFDNKKKNSARHGDAMDSRQKADLVYIDPPYYSPYSDNEYVRRYHFLEGLARDWQGVEIQEHTITKKFKSYPTPFTRAQTAYSAFDVLFRRHQKSILLVSYSSNSLPTENQMIELMSKYKANVEVVAIDHRYSCGNQAHKVGDNNNKVKEFLFVGY